MSAKMGEGELFSLWRVKNIIVNLLADMIIDSNVDIDLSYLCQGYEDDPDSAYDSIKSFPSGHAQLSCFAAAFNIVSNNMAGYRIVIFVFSIRYICIED